MIFDITSHPSLPLMITGSISGEISIYNYAKNSILFKDYKHFEAVRSVDCDHDRKVKCLIIGIISASADSSFQLYSLSGKIILKKNSSHDSIPVNVIKSISQKLVLSGADDGSVKLWDISSKSLIHSWKENSDYISDMLCIDHQILVAGSDGLLSVFDDRNRKALAVSEYQEDELTCFCLVKNGTKLAVGTESGTLLLFNVGEWGDHTDRIKLNHGAIESIVKWNESMVIVSCDDGSIYSVNIFPNSVGKCLQGPTANSIDSLILSLDSHTLLGMSSTDENETLVKISTANLTSEAQDSFFADLT